MLLLDGDGIQGLTNALGFNELEGPLSAALGLPEYVSQQQFMESKNFVEEVKINCVLC